MSDKSYCIEVIRVEGVSLKKGLLRSSVPSFYVEIALCDLEQRTKTVKKELAPTWHEELRFSSPSADAILTARLKRERSIRQNFCVGVAQITLQELLQRSITGEVQLHLSAATNEASPPPRGSIYLRLKTITSNDHILGDIAAAKDATEDAGIREQQILTPGVLDGFTSGSDSTKGLYYALQGLLSRLDTFIAVMDALSEIHPYLSAAWGIVSSLHKAVSRQFESDKKVITLIGVMEKAFSFVTELDDIREKVNVLHDTLIRLLKQTHECCVFVRDYVHRSFSARLLSGKEKQIEDFQRSFEELKRELDSGMAAQTVFVTVRTAKTIDTLFLQGTLNPVEGNAFNRPQCLDSTRLEIRREIMNWLLSEPKENVLWVYGVAGSGKSTVMMSIAEYLRSLHRLGAFLFFERSKSDPSSIFRTLAYQLASFDPFIATSVNKVVEADNGIATASAGRQFDQLIKTPLIESEKDVDGPIVIILDALDECGTPETRRNMLQLLRYGLPQLPPKYLFLITSRREPDIDLALSDNPTTIRMELNFATADTRRDVRFYLNHELRLAIEYVGITVPSTWPWDAHLGRLAEMADGLFVWASTVVRIVQRSDNPFQKLQELSEGSHHLRGMDELYATALRTSGISWEEESSRERFSLVVSLLLLNRAPISDDMIDVLLGFSNAKPSYLVLSKLRSILIYTKGEPIQFFHSSLIDYLTSPNRRHDPWFINIPTTEHDVVIRCLITMEDGLSFNIGDIDSSFTGNIKIDEEKLREIIPPHLRYACLCWAGHLARARFSTQLMEKLSSFVLQRLLWWFEVMSLLKRFSDVSMVLESASRWTSSHGSRLSSLLQEAKTMATLFQLPITRNPAHIYASALPWTVDDLDISSQYYSPMTLKHRPIIRTFGVRTSPLWSKVLEGHTDFVSSLSISPDGKKVVSASRDTTVRVWDIDAGELCMPPLKGHDAGVMAVAYSPDGRYIVSGSYDKTICIWDAISGRPKTQLRGHHGAVTSIAFSPDNSQIISGSQDRTVRLWDTLSGVARGEPLTGHEDFVVAIAFSPDGRQFASASWDHTIILWSVYPGIPNKVLRKHNNSVLSISYSSDGLRLVSGSWDRSIIIWDTRSGEILCGPVFGYSGVFSSVSFSPDDKHIVSGSHGGAIHIWSSTDLTTVVSFPDAYLGKISSVIFTRDGSHIISASRDHSVRVWDTRRVGTGSQPHEHDSAHILFVAYTDDGTHIISASWGGTIHIRDAQNGTLVSRPFTGHSSGISSISFFRGNRNFVSGSYDGAVRIWDMKTGEAVSGPLKGHREAGAAVLCIEVSQNTSHFASGSKDGTVAIWKLEGEHAVSMHSALEGHTDRVTGLSFSCDGHLLASGSSDYSIRLWDVEKGVCIGSPFRGLCGVTCIAFSPDGCSVIAGYRKQQVRLWDICNGNCVAKFVTSGACISIAFSPSGTQAVIGTDTNTIELWDVNSGIRLLGPIDGHSSAVTSVAFSPDGLHIVSGSRDATIRTWAIHHHQYFTHADAVTSVAFSADGLITVSGSRDGLVHVRNSQHGDRTIEPFRGHTQEVLSVAVSPGGDHIVSGSADKSIRIWKIPTYSRNLGVGLGSYSIRVRP